MAFQFDRWFRYAKAKARGAVSSGNRELDRLEAEREAERADKPWLSKDGEDLSFDQVKARIEWEEARAGSASTGSGSVGSEPADREDPSATAEAPAPESASTPSAGRSVPPLAEPAQVAADAEAEMARLELEAREQASKERLDAIRQELGVEPPADGT